MKLAEQMERIYREMPPASIPWNHQVPPELLVQLVESGWVTPCDAVDLGCGAGNYTAWLAARGFRMTGVDLSPGAIELARARATALGVACRFLASDLLGEVELPAASFDFAFDWEVLHHVFPADRERYVAAVHRLLRPGGRYYSVCFELAAATAFPGEGKFRTTPLGTRLYFSEAAELRRLFEPWFTIDSLGETTVAGRTGRHPVIEARLLRKERAPSHGAG
jgi:SAM-dependent methyltransferase